MQNFTAYLILCVGLFLPSFLNWLMLRFWLPDWWQRRLVRITMKLSILAAAAVFVRIIGATWLGFKTSPSIMGLGLALTWLPQIALLISLPVVVVWLKAGTRALRRDANPSEEKIDQKRRAFLRTSAAALPVVAVGTCVGGILETLRPAKVFVEPAIFPDLPAPLSNLRILHLTDIHLGGFMLLDSLAETLNNARVHQPDLIVVTGDLADDLKLLPEAFSMLEKFGAPLGVYAILGNHEYSRGVEVFKSIIARSKVRLLVNTGHRISVGGATVYLAGVDDVMGKPKGVKRTQYMEKCVAQSLAGRQSGDFTILLSHRPDTFPLAADHAVAFTLSGHTHGGQAALGGHSWLEAFGIKEFVWGFYRLKESLLYTSSGAGQWAPVRLGCPAEAPIFELTRTDPS